MILWAVHKSSASGIARSTINRGIAELKAGRNELGARIRRRGGGRKRAVEGQPGLLAALEGLIEGAIRGDPQSPLRWVSRSQRNIAAVLGQQGFEASQKLVGVLLRQLDYRTPRTLTESRCPDLRRSDSGLRIPVGDEAA